MLIGWILTGLKNYCSDHIAAVKEKKSKKIYFFSIESGMEISLACRRTGERDVFSEKIFSQKVCGTVGGACRNAVYLRYFKQPEFILIIDYKITGWTI